jgi:hypothetical protein
MRPFVGAQWPLAMMESAHCVLISGSTYNGRALGQVFTVLGLTYSAITSVCSQTSASLFKLSGSDRIGGCSILFSFRQYCPCNPGKLIGHGYSGDVVVGSGL